MFIRKVSVFLNATAHTQTDDVALFISFLMFFEGIHMFAALVTPASTKIPSSRFAPAPSRTLLSQMSPGLSEMLHHRSAMTDCHRDRMRGLWPITPLRLFNPTYQYTICNLFTVACLFYGCSSVALLGGTHDFIPNIAENKKMFSLYFHKITWTSHSAALPTSFK